MFEKIKTILGFTTKRRINRIIKKLESHNLFIHRQKELIEKNIIEISQAYSNKLKLLKLATSENLKGYANTKKLKESLVILISNQKYLLDDLNVQLEHVDIVVIDELKTLPLNSLKEEEVRITKLKEPLEAILKSIMPEYLSFLESQINQISSDLSFNNLFEKSRTVERNFVDSVKKLDHWSVSYITGLSRSIMDRITKIKRSKEALDAILPEQNKLIVFLGGYGRFGNASGSAICYFKNFGGYYFGWYSLEQNLLYQTCDLILTISNQGNREIGGNLIRFKRNEDNREFIERFPDSIKDIEDFLASLQKLIDYTKEKLRTWKN